MAENENTSPGFARNPDYSIALEPAMHRVRVEFNGVTIADSAYVLLMREQKHGAVCYFPRADVAMEHLQRTDHSTHCPYKGDASYWTLSVGDRTDDNVVWSYETPFDEVSRIKDYVAFYRDRMDAWYEDDEPLLGRSH